MRDETYRKQVGIPPRVFLYTLDQVAAMLSVSEHDIRYFLVYYEGRSVGGQPVKKLRAVNIRPDDDNPEWRIPESELVRWFKAKKIKYYERRL